MKRKKYLSPAFMWLQVNISDEVLSVSMPFINDNDNDDEDIFGDDYNEIYEDPVNGVGGEDSDMNNWEW